jgi:FdhD protein
MGMTGRTSRRRVVRVSLDGGAGPRADLLAAEEPLGIRIGGQAVTLTMRTPGDDLDLVAGFLVTEGIARSAADIAELRICSGERCGHDHSADGEDLGNVADVTLAPGIELRAGQRRNFLTSSACGVCGKTSIAELSVTGSYDLSRDAARVTPEVLAGLPGALRAAQRVFDRTGGLHAAGLFTAAGDLLAVREDVGRHNAVDKAVGSRILAGEPVPPVLVLSGRIGFELVQKAVVSGIGAVVAVGAPTSLARELASTAGLVVVGFTKGDRCVVYTGAEHVKDT